VRIVLREDIDTLGRKGDLLDVADGYARNFLVPRGLAFQATRGAVQQAETMRRSREVRDTRDRDAAQVLADQLSGVRIELKARAGEGGKLFGSVTNADIAAAVTAQTGVELDRRKIDLAEPLKVLGPAELTLRLHPDVVTVLQVEVIAE
jgi:large subunit ribosomal protein L9